MSFSESALKGLARSRKFPSAGGEGMLHCRRLMRVLVVDDNVDAADSLGMLLRLEQHLVDVVYDGHAALAKARLTQPALVFVDIGMPGMNGYELAQRLH